MRKGTTKLLDKQNEFITKKTAQILRFVLFLFL